MWKTCKRFPMYEVNEHGDVRSKETQKIMKQRVNSRGYLRLNLYCNGERKTVYSYRLVAEAFIPNPNNLPCVNHKDENKLNNDVSNLEWCTIAYNNRYGTKLKRQSDNSGKPIVAFNSTVFLRFKSLTQAAEVMDCVPSTIYKAINNKEFAFYKGLVWHYVDDPLPEKHGAAFSKTLG